MGVGLALLAITMVVGMPFLLAVIISVGIVSALAFAALGASVVGSRGEASRLENPVEDAAPAGGEGSGRAHTHPVG